MADEKVRPKVTPTREHIAQLACLLVGLALCAAACAATPRPAAEWVKTRESAEDFARARQACEQQSLAEVNQETADSIAARAGVGGFFKCMKDKGWAQVPKATPTPAAHSGPQPASFLWPAPRPHETVDFVGTVLQRFGTTRRRGMNSPAQSPKVG